MSAEFDMYDYLHSTGWKYVSANRVDLWRCPKCSCLLEIGFTERHLGWHATND